jgi:hypothetical protein
MHAEQMQVDSLPRPEAEEGEGGQPGAHPSIAAAWAAWGSAEPPAMGPLLRWLELHGIQAAFAPGAGSRANGGRERTEFRALVQLLEAVLRRVMHAPGQAAAERPLQEEQERTVVTALLGRLGAASFYPWLLEQHQRLLQPDEPPPQPADAFDPAGVHVKLGVLLCGCAEILGAAAPGELGGAEIAAVLAGQPPPPGASMCATLGGVRVLTALAHLCLRTGDSPQGLRMLLWRLLPSVTGGRQPGARDQEDAAAEAWLWSVALPALAQAQRAAADHASDAHLLHRTTALLAHLALARGPPSEHHEPTPLSDLSILMQVLQHGPQGLAALRIAWWPSAREMEPDMRLITWVWASARPPGSPWRSLACWLTAQWRSKVGVLVSFTFPYAGSHHR